jgi:multidrug efflux pump subunit AcrA (membrane-fusion protein)
MVPDEAILSDQERKYVWVVGAKKDVAYRPVKLGQLVWDWRVIRAAEPGREGKEGLATGDAIVVSGMQRVRDGVQVDAEAQALPPPPEMPLARLWERAHLLGK